MIDLAMQDLARNFLEPEGGLRTT